jgi:tight adherence protein B
MTASGWVGAVAVAGAAAILAGPTMSARRRWRRLARNLGSGPAHANATRSVGPRRGATRGGAAGWLGQDSAWRWSGIAGTLAGLPAAVLLGAPGGLAAGAYAALGVVVTRRRLRERAAARARTGAVDAVAGLATDLRAGLGLGAALAAATPALSEVDGGERVAPVAGRVTAAIELAEATGAPLADVLERLDADLRAADRVRAIALAQLAGARASAWLLAAMPVAGVGLGHAIGADPMRVLLHTPLGAACLLGAVMLQLAGLTWADRLARVGVAP